MLSVEAVQERSISDPDLTMPARLVGVPGAVVSFGVVRTTSCGLFVPSLVWKVTVVVVDGSVMPKLIGARVVTADVTLAVLYALAVVELTVESVAPIAGALP